LHRPPLSPFGGLLFIGHLSPHSVFKKDEKLLFGKNN